MTLWKSFILSFSDTLTAFYLPTVIELLHAGAVAFSVVSLWRGRLYAQTQWYDLVDSFYGSDELAQRPVARTP